MGAGGRRHLVREPLGPGSRRPQTGHPPWAESPPATSRRVQGQSRSPLRQPAPRTPKRAHCKATPALGSLQSSQQSHVVSNQPLKGITSELGSNMQTTHVLETKRITLDLPRDQDGAGHCSPFSFQTFYILTEVVFACNQYC